MTLLAYLPAATRCGWIWDDDYYVTRNANLRDARGPVNIWTKIGLANGGTPQYYPVTHTTFWLEYHLWELHPSGYHVINILLHAASAVMLWIVLKKLDVCGAWLAAAVWSLHPVNVESIAWVTERKNVLSGFFYFAAMLAYLRWQARADEKRWYALALACFVCALLSKSVAASLPAVILLIVWWKRGAVRWRDLAPLLPMFVLGAAMGWLTGHVERHYVGAQGPEFDFSIAQRVLIAGRAVWFYACKLIWPAKLSFIYTRWNVDARDPLQWLFPLALVATIAGVVASFRHNRRGIVVAILFFCGTLLPALGFVNVLPMRYSFVADHFQYIAGIGLIVLIVSLLITLLPPKGRWIVRVVLPLTLAILTWRRQAAFAGLESLWADTVAKNPTGWMPRLNYAKVLMGEHRLAVAADQLDAAAKLKPDSAEIASVRASLFVQQGQTRRAIDEFDRAIELEPRFAEPHVHLGELLRRGGDVTGAIGQFRLAIDIWQSFGPAFADPDSAAAVYNNLGTCYEQIGDAAAALDAYESALRLRPKFEPAMKNRDRLRRAVSPSS